MGKTFSFCVWYHSLLVGLARIKNTRKTGHRQSLRSSVGKMFTF